MPVIFGITSLTKTGKSESVRKPWAIGPPKGDSFLALSGSIWIHWKSPVASAKALILSCETVNHEPQPISFPINFLKSSTEIVPAFVAEWVTRYYL